MRSNFTKGFTKTAGIVGSAAKTVGKGLKTVGKGAIALGGGPLNAALTGLGAVSDYSDISNKMRAAAQR